MCFLCGKLAAKGRFFNIQSSSGFPRVLPGSKSFSGFLKMPQWARKRAVRPVHKNITGINAPKGGMNIAIWLESVIISA